MTHTEQVRVKQGAAATRRKKGTLMDALKDICRATSDGAKQFREWSTVVDENSDYLHELKVYGYVNYLRTLHKDERREATKSQRQKELEARDIEVDRLVGEIRKSVADTTMPNGKRLGDCTREDLLQMAERERRLAAKLKPGQTVEQGLTEKQLQKLWTQGV